MLSDLYVAHSTIHKFHLKSNTKQRNINAFVTSAEGKYVKAKVIV